MPEAHYSKTISTQHVIGRVKAASDPPRPQCKEVLVGIDVDVHMVHLTFRFLDRPEFRPAPLSNIGFGDNPVRCMTGCAGLDGESDTDAEEFADAGGDDHREDTPTHDAYERRTNRGASNPRAEVSESG